jgi:hypothetical protein
MDLVTRSQSICDATSTAYQSCLDTLAKADDGYGGGSVGVMVVLIIVCLTLPLIFAIVWCMRRKWENNHPDRIKYITIGGRQVRQSTLVGAFGAYHFMSEARRGTQLGGSVQDMQRDLARHDSTLINDNPLRDAMMGDKS